MKRAGQKIEGLSLKSMIVKSLLIAAALAMPYNLALAAPQTSLRQTEDLSTILNKLKIGIHDLKYEMNNHESEIRKFENRLYGQEAAFDSIRENLKEDLQILKDSAKSAQINFEGRIVKLEQLVEHLTKASSAVSEDLRQLKNHADESSSLLSQYLQKFSDLEKTIQVQKQEVYHLQTALQTMMEALELKESIHQHAGGTYKVQPGDTLEKIAKTHKISLQTLKDANNLKGDKIVVGQNLKIP